MSVLFFTTLLTYAPKNPTVLRSPHVLMQTMYDLRVISNHDYTCWFQKQPDYHRYVIPDLEFQNRSYEYLSVTNVGVNFAYGSVDHQLWDTTINWIDIFHDRSENYVVKKINEKFREVSKGEISQFMNSSQYNYDWYISLFSMATLKPVWKYGFSEFHTCTFETPESIRTNFMQTPELAINYASIDKFTAVELPLENKFYSLLLLLPNKGDNIDHFVTTIDTPKLMGIYRQLEPTNLTVVIPRNTFEDWHYSKNIYTQSNFAKPFYEFIYRPVRDQAQHPLNERVQKLKVVFDTNGVENAKPLENRKVNKLFLANRPFWFLFVERRVNVILLVGHIKKPGMEMHELNDAMGCPQVEIS
ncbi:serpin B5-like [Uranotaenia lowii]|uniref:serpin B5-like n=1 Tax=Uranotaenia lowii TaxID=190385 RepID=UPI00247AAE61|nr:serpin B5-like [Uranotaenia lowii]